MPLIQRVTYSAPAILWVLMVICLPILPAQEEADTPDALEVAWQALKDGEADAASKAVAALKEEPKSAERNLCLSLALFWKGQFKDAPRYLRRAIAYDFQIVLDCDKPSELMPVDGYRRQLTALAQLAEGNVEACFLTGSLLSLNKDSIRATAFLLRAEELATTDGQAERLRKGSLDTRNLKHGKIALAEGKFNEAARSFMLALFEFPNRPFARAALAVCLAGLGQTDMAVSMLEKLAEIEKPDEMLDSLRTINVPARQLAPLVAALNSDKETLSRLRLGALLAFTVGYYNSAREISLKGLVLNQLDTLCFDIRDYLERNKLLGDPEPETKKPVNQPEEVPVKSSLPKIKKLINKEEFSEALTLLLEYTGSDQHAYLLVYVAGVGAAQFNAASQGLQHWVAKLNAKEPFQLNAIRKLFERNDTFEDWALGLEVAMRADPDQSDLRLLHAYSECTRGNFGQARDDLEIASASLPANKTITLLIQYLKKPEFENDTMPDVVKNPPSPESLHLLGKKAFNESDFKKAIDYFNKAAEANPELNGITKSLIRSSFALGEYAKAMRYMRALFKEQDLLQDGVTEFSFRMGTGYSNGTVYEEHLNNLRKAAREAFVGEDEWMLLGSINFGRRNWKEARNALQNWHDKTTSKALDPILLRMLEHAKKKSN
ncbi:MAG: hypothetical protein L3J82_07465 [Planctomycetes bacterium]|nr:hypothetical protein [Planctomycetota bacterium]